MSVITSKVSTAYGNSVDEITRVVKGPQSENEARKVAMYLCQELSAAKLREIAGYFNLGHAGSVSYITHKIRILRNEDKRFNGRVEGLINSIIRQAT